MQIVANSLFLSVFYISFAMGLTVIFGVMRTINFAHGEFYMLGGYVLWLTLPLLAPSVGAPLAFIFALLVGAGVLALLGVVLQLTIVSRLEGDPFAIFMSTLGLSYVLQVAVVQFVGPMGRSVPPVFPGILNLGFAILPWQRLVIAGLVIFTMLALWSFLQFTNSGRAIRATAQNRTGAILQGMSPYKIGALTMGTGAALAGIAGVLMGSVLGVNPFMGGEAIWRAFIIIIVGGIGSLPGTVLAGLLFGTLDTLLATYGLGRFVALVDASIMLIVLSFMPNGLLGQKE